MEVTEFFLKLLLILASAKVMAEIFAHFGLPSVIGEVLAGVIIGPSLMGFIGPEPTFMLLAQVGILFLLFQVGMETDVAQVLAVGGQSVMVAVTGVALPFVFGYLFSHYLFRQSNAVAVFIGGTLVATSIGITLRVLRDLGRQRSRIAHVVLGSAVLDDVIGIIILAMLLQYTFEGKIDFASSWRVLGFAAVLLIAAPVLSRFFILFMAKMDAVSKTAGVISTMLVAFILALSVLAHGFGTPEIVGAFTAGLAITRKSIFDTDKHLQGIREKMVAKAAESMTPISDLFIPIFFVMVGVSINLRAIDFGSSRFWIFAGAMTLLAFISKVLSGVWVKGTSFCKLSVGVAMIPRGEVGLIFAQTGLKNGIFDDAVYTSMVFVVAITTLLAPLLLKYLLAHEKRDAVY